MTDIVERLRAEPHRVSTGLVLEAATEIERLRGVEQDAAEWVEERTKRLRADNERLRAALEDIDTNLNVWSPHPAGSVQATMRDIARAALGEE